MSRKEVWEIRILSVIAAFIVLGGGYGLMRLDMYVSAVERAAAQAEPSPALSFSRAPSLPAAPDPVQRKAERQAPLQALAVSEAPDDGALRLAKPAKPAKGDPRPKWTNLRENEETPENRSVMRRIPLTAPPAASGEGGAAGDAAVN